MAFGPANTLSSDLPIDFNLTKDQEVNNELISKRHRQIANIMNVKENAQYEKTELLSGKQFFNPNVTQYTGTGVSRVARTGFRLTFDLVALNLGVAIPGGPTTFTLSTTLPAPDGTQPLPINIPTALIPIDGYGAATNGTNFYFINDPLLFVRTNIWTSGLQKITIENNTGSPLTTCIWIFEYLKT